MSGQNEFSSAFSTAFDADETTGGCDWPVSYLGCEDCKPLTELENADRSKVEQMAIDLLGRWTNGVFGVCDTTVRPCRSECVGTTSTWWGKGPFPWGGTAGGWVPYLLDGKWYNAYCGGCLKDVGCGCSSGDSISLPGPVQSITQVRIDGVVLDPSSYRVDNRRWLVRTDGGEWPRCQNLDSNADEPGTFEVRYKRGVPVPDGGQVAAGVLACELAKALCNDQTCGLPERVQSITRQGVTVAVLDSFEDVEKGRTGIWLIDSWVASITGPTPRSRVYSPDVKRPAMRRTTWRV